MHLDPEAFEALVAQAVDQLPEWVRAHIDNVAITLQQAPSPEQRRAGRVRDGFELLGLYEGVPLTQRGRGYQMVPPDRITLFQRALERSAPDATALVALIRHTIIHEIAHHFGFSEERLRELDC